MYFGCFPSKSHFEPLWGPSWGPLAALFSLKQGRLGAPRRSGAPTDYFFSALGVPKRPQRAPQKLSWTPRGPPKGPQGAPEAPGHPYLGPFWTHFMVICGPLWGSCFLARGIHNHLGKRLRNNMPFRSFFVGARRLSRSDWDSGPGARVRVVGAGSP